MRLRNILAILASLLCLAGCQSEKQEIPAPLIGYWKTSAPGYESNWLELRKNEILFGLGGSKFSANSVWKVETVRRAGENASLIIIHYIDDEGNDRASTISYDPAHPGELHFQYQKQIEWKLVSRGVTEGGYPLRRRPLTSWWEGFNWSIPVALLGVALITGAVLWRWQEGRVQELTATLERAQTASAQPMGGERESSQIGWAGWGADRGPAADKVPEIVAKERRRSERILLKIPLQVSGLGVDGNYFREQTFTLSISRHGAFMWLKNLPRQGDPVTVINLGTRQSCLFRLCEFDKEPSGEFTAWGIECLEPDSNFWQIRFPDRPPESSTVNNVAALIVCATCHSREVAELTGPEYQAMLGRETAKRDCVTCGGSTEWKFMAVEATRERSPQEASEAIAPTGEERRRERRIVAKLPIRLRHPEDGRVEHTLTENVSKSGVCFAASMELNVDEVILLTFEPRAGQGADEIPARIIWRQRIAENRKTLYGIRLERGDGDPSPRSG